MRAILAVAATEQRIGMRDTNQDYAVHDATEQAILLVAGLFAAPFFFCFCFLLIV